MCPINRVGCVRNNCWSWCWLCTAARHWRPCLGYLSVAMGPGERSSKGIWHGAYSDCLLLLLLHAMQTPVQFLQELVGHYSFTSPDTHSQMILINCRAAWRNTPTLCATTPVWRLSPGVVITFPPPFALLIPSYILHIFSASLTI